MSGDVGDVGDQPTSTDVLTTQKFIAINRKNMHVDGSERIPDIADSTDALALSASEDCSPTSPTTSCGSLLHEHTSMS